MKSKIIDFIESVSIDINTGLWSRLLVEMKDKLSNEEAAQCFNFIADTLDIRKELEDARQSLFYEYAEYYMPVSAKKVRINTVLDAFNGNWFGYDRADAFDLLLDGIWHCEYQSDDYYLILK